MPGALNTSTQEAPNGFKANIAGLDCYVTEILDDDGTNSFGAVFNPRRAFVGMYSKDVIMLRDEDADFFKTKNGMYLYSDFAVHYQEALCLFASAL